MRPALSLQDACEIRAICTGQSGEIEIICRQYRTTYRTVMEIISGEWFDEMAATEIENEAEHS